MNQYILLDIGNTNIKYAEVSDGTIVSSKITETNKYKDLEKMVNKSKNVFISSVVPEINTYFENLNINSYFVSHDNIANINVKIPNPAELGADLIINASAANELTKSRNLIIDLGTALTFCHVDKNGNYLGCLIFPGNKIASESLSIKTSQLSYVEMNQYDLLVGTNTEEAIGAGLFKGYVHLINGFIDEFKSKHKDLKVVGSGKGIKQFENYINLDFYDDNLTIRGLNLFAQSIINKN
ncbi:MAG: type III pantothenate kinase [Dehalococcoidia bacterium]